MPVTRYDIRKKFSTSLNRTGLTKILLTTVAAKNSKLRLIDSPLTNGGETPSQL